jgi:hypothetical protein
MASMEGAESPQEHSMDDIFSAISSIIAAAGARREPVLGAGDEQGGVLEPTGSADDERGLRRPAGRQRGSNVRQNL